MKLPVRKRHFPRLGFGLTVGVLAVLIVAYCIHDYGRATSRLEQSLVREALSIVAAFEASVRAGLTGRAILDTEKFRALVRDTCHRADLDFFAFVDPSLRVYQVTQTNEVWYHDRALTNLYALLQREPYSWGYSCQHDGQSTLNVVKPLLLDNDERIGKRTFRFYQMLLNRRGQGRLMREMRPYRRQTLSLPLAIVGLPTTDIRQLSRQAVVQSVSLGIVFLLLGTSVIYISVVVEQQRATAKALTDVRADNVRLLRSLQRSDRLAILGRMAATMAHELRNPLSSVRGFTQLFRKKLEQQGDRKLCEFADVVIKEVDRLNTVIGNMLNFSKPIEPNFQTHLLDQLVENVFRLVRSDASSRRVTLIAHIPDSLPRVYVDATLFTQALLNLVINALDAMPDGGELTIEAKQGPDSQVSIFVRDTGKGIPREQIDRVFDPFFTTKPSGTGLGLATVENIVAEHSGSISVESEVDRGSVFRIDLPGAVDVAA